MVCLHIAIEIFRKIDVSHSLSNYSNFPKTKQTNFSFIVPNYDSTLVLATMASPDDKIDVNGASFYALHVALQTLKERCQNLQHVSENKRRDVVIVRNI